MTDYAELEKRLRERADDVDPITRHDRAEKDGVSWSDGESCALMREAAAALAALARELDGRPTIEEWSAEIDRVRDHWKGNVAKLEREIVETLDPLATHERSGHLRIMGNDELFSFTLPVKDWLRMISLDLRRSKEPSA